MLHKKIRIGDYNDYVPTWFVFTAYFFVEKIIFIRYLS